MRRFELAGHEERLALVPLGLEPIEHAVGYAVGRMPLHPNLGSFAVAERAFKEGRVKVLPLLRHHLVVVEG